MADIIKTESDNLDQSTSYYLMFSVDADDNSAFESESTEIFSETQIIEKKAVRKVRMLFYTNDNSKRIEFQAIHTEIDEKIDNFIAVSGDEATWVNGIYGRMIEIINSAEDQPKFINDFSGWLIFIACLLINMYVFNFLGRHNLLESISPFFLLGFPFVTLILAYRLSLFVNTVWP